MPLCVNYWVYERDFCMVIKSKVLAVEWQVFCAKRSKYEPNKKLPVENERPEYA